MFMDDSRCITWVPPPQQMLKSTQAKVSEPCGLGSGELLRLSDETVMAHLQAGHADALAILFDRYHRLILSIAMKILRDVGEAEDLMQSVFLEIYKCAAQFDAAKGTTKVWILQYAYHRALHRKRHLVANHFYRWEELEAALDLGLDHALPGEPPEIARLAEQMLERLKPRQRAVLQMTYYEGLTAEEIAKRLGESVHVVRHDLHRGLASLRAVFNT